MAQKADGSVYIDTLLSTSGFQAGSKELDAAVKRVIAKVAKIGGAAEAAAQKMGNALTKQNQAVAQQKEKVAMVRHELSELQNQKVETEKYAAVNKEINKLETELDKVTKRQNKFLETGGKETSQTYRNMEYDVSKLERSLSNANFLKDSLERSGQAFTVPDTSGAEQKLVAEEQKLQQMTDALGTSFLNLKNKLNSYGVSTSELTRKKITLTGAFSSFLSSAKKTAQTVGGKLLSSLKKAGTAMLGLHKSAKKTNGAFNTGFKTFLKYGLGIRSLFVLFNRLRQALIEGFENLAQFDNRTNTSISSLKSSLTQLKNSFATAFAPLLNAVAPILNQFINLISKAVTYVGMFIAALTGQSTFTKAVGVQENYAASLNDSAEAAKKAEKATSGYLSGLDEITRFQTKDSDSDSASGGGYTAPKPQNMFETVPIEGKVKDFAEKVKKTLSEMFTPLKEAWNEYGGSITNTFSKIIKDIGTFGSDIAKSTVSWFKNLDWKPLANSVDKLMKSLEPIIKGGLDGLKWVYENILQPLGKWTIEEAVPAALEAIGGALDVIYAVGEKVKPILEGIWNNFLKPVADWVGDAVTGFVEGFGQFLKDIAENDTAVSFLTGVATALGVVAGAIGAVHAAMAIWNAIMAASPITWIVSGIVALVAAITACIVYWDEISAAVKDAWETIKKCFGKIGDWFDEKFKKARDAIVGVFKDIGDWFGDRWEDIKDAFSDVKDWFKTKFENAKTAVTNTFSNIGTWFSNKKTEITNAFSNINTWFKTKFESAKTAVTNAFSNIGTWFANKKTEITNAFSNINTWFKTKFESAKSAVTNAFSGVTTFFTNLKNSICKIFDSLSSKITGIWNGIKTTIKNAVNGIIKFINKMMSGIAKGVNSVIGGLNKVGGVFGIELKPIVAPKIPLLATGAVIPPNAPFAAILGDQRHGTNIETPEALLRKIVREEMGGQAGANNSYEFVAQLNGRNIFDALIDEAKLRQSKTGRNPFALA